MNHCKTLGLKRHVYFLLRKKDLAKLQNSVTVLIASLYQMAEYSDIPLDELERNSSGQGFLLNNTMHSFAWETTYCHRQGSSNEETEGSDLRYQWLSGTRCVLHNKFYRLSPQSES